MALIKRLAIFLSLFATAVVAADAVIYSGDAVKTMRDQIKIRDTASILTGTADPSSTATDAKRGSLYLRQGTVGAAYVKTDDGLSTNWSTATGTSGTNTYVMANVSSDIGGGYFQLVGLPAYVTATAAAVTVSVGTAETLIATLATNIGFPNATTIPVGQFFAHYETTKASGPNNYYTYFKVFKRASGGTETLLSTSDSTSQTALNTVVNQNSTALITSAFTVLPTDRLVIKVYGRLLASSANVTLAFDGATNARFELPAATVDATNFIPYTGATLNVDVGAKSVTATNYVASSASELRLNNAANTFYTGFKSGNAAANKIWTLPLVDGAVGNRLTTNGSGTLGWSGSDILNGGNSFGGTMSIGTGDLNQVDFLVNTTVVMSLLPASVTMFQQHLAGSGTVALPAYSFSGDPNTGIFSGISDNIRFGTNGVERLTLNNSGITATIPYIASAGAAATPSFTFNSDLDTGMFSSVANAIEFSTGGTSRANISSLGVLSTNGVFSSNADVTLNPAGGAAKLTTTSANGTAIVGTTTNDSATALNVGEFVSCTAGATVAPGASNAYKNLCTVSLTAGDWDVTANAEMTGGTTTTALDFLKTGISKTTNALDLLNVGGYVSVSIPNFIQGFPETYQSSPRRISIASTTPIYLVGLIQYGSVGNALWGSNSFMSARRVR